MTHAEALQRAKAALEKAYVDSEAFDYLASFEIMACITEALEAEFCAPKKIRNRTGGDDGK